MPGLHLLLVEERKTGISRGAARLGESLAALYCLDKALN